MAMTVKKLIGNSKLGLTILALSGLAMSFVISQPVAAQSKDDCERVGRLEDGRELYACESEIPVASPNDEQALSSRNALQNPSLRPVPGDHPNRRSSQTSPSNQSGLEGFIAGDHPN